MENYIMVKGEKIELTEDQIKRISKAYAEKNVCLGDVDPGQLIRIGEHTFIVLEQTGDSTKLIRKDLLKEKTAFGSNNHYDRSKVDVICNDFANEIADLVGLENMLEYEVDLTSNDGLKEHGVIRRKVSLLTAEMYRKYVYTLNHHKPDSWWWLATPFSIKPNDPAENCILCVSPAGFINYCYYYRDYFGVRPFCILKSSIFVSRENANG